jgi:hypothetical protein
VNTKKTLLIDSTYPKLMAQLVGLLERARVNSARTVNAVMTATYWEIGRRIAEQEQRGEKRARYGKALLRRLAEDLTPRFGRGFSERNLLAMREFYRAWSIPQTPSAELAGPGIAANILQNPQTPSAESNAVESPAPFPLPWSHYVRLLSVTNSQARSSFANSGRQVTSRSSSSRHRSSQMRQGTCALGCM